MSALDFYYGRIAAAYVRGTLGPATGPGGPDADLFLKPLDELAPDALERLIALGLATGLRLHRFKRTMGLPRVKRVLGVLRGLAPSDLLDVGSGRGAFLWPLLDAFPALPVTAIDRDPQRVRMLQAVAAGGIDSLGVRAQDVTAMDFGRGSFDVVTMLEVLEHIPDAPRALGEAVRVARRAVVLSVPSRADDNPEHIHLFDRDQLERLFGRAGARSVRFEYVLNHLIAVATIG